MAQPGERPDIPAPVGAAAPIPRPAGPELSERPHLVVGLGASAGGLEAYRQFFSAVPADTGMSFVLVQHLDPHAESLLASIMAGYTVLPVEIARQDATIRPNCVYVIPPDSILTIHEDRFHLVSPASVAARRTSINTFLASLAREKGEDAIGIILSGFGSDGALGIAAIKERGGLTLSQAEYDHHAKWGMPQSAASGGFVDYVMAADAMPARLIEYQQHRMVCDGAKGADGLRRDLPSHLPTICGLMHDRLNRDFSHYKTGTLMRRIQRRMHVQRTEQVSDYVERLRSQPDEAEHLLRELLISVTSFFRDNEVFEALEARILPDLVAATPPDQAIRVWVAGCATGEEAYSVAILLREALGRAASRSPVQIFATDIDAAAIDVARAGLYPASVAVDLSVERLDRFFTREDGHVRIAKELREMCLFSVHDLIKDPPFSRLDLVCCRNLMIYFDTQLQNQVLTRFHFALRPARMLVLGISESAGGQSRLFEPLDKKCRIYRRDDATRSFPGPSPTWLDTHLTPKRSSPTAGRDDIDRRAARAMARYAPAFLVVNANADILRFSGQTAKYLEPATGLATLSLFTLLHANLRGTARSALRQAVASSERVVHEALQIDAGTHPELVTLSVEPLVPATGETLYLLTFQDLGRSAEAATVGGETRTPELERELRITRERLREALDSFESMTLELQSSNENFLSLNEELQSANEELETSKEEMQSLNEELQTINAELNQRNESLVQSSNDLTNLFNSTAVATLFLDKEMCIRRFTPRIQEIFKVRGGDEGRPITDIVARLSETGLVEAMQGVLHDLAPMEREVTASDGPTSYLMQVRPYMSPDNAVDGVVVTFIDITERKRGEELRARLAAIVDGSQDAIIGLDPDGTVTSWNRGAELLFGCRSEDAHGRPLPALLAGVLPDDWPSMLQDLERGEPVPVIDRSGEAGPGGLVHVSLTLSPVRRDDGQVSGLSLIARDISARRLAEERTALVLGELDHRVRNILAIVSAVVGRTLKGSAAAPELVEELDGRILAIARAHALLTESGRGRIDLSALVRTELAPFDRDGGSCSVNGPRIALTPNAGMALAMAVHELASNAAKYGALSRSMGSVSVAWEIGEAETGPVLNLRWVEAGGPPVAPPTRQGFGTTLIERALRHDLGAVVTRAFPPTGVTCTLDIPFGATVGERMLPA